MFKAWRPMILSVVWDIYHSCRENTSLHMRRLTTAFWWICVHTNIQMLCKTMPEISRIHLTILQFLAAWNLYSAMTTYIHILIYDSFSTCGVRGVVVSTRAVVLRVWIVQMPDSPVIIVTFVSMIMTITDQSILPWPYDATLTVRSRALTSGLPETRGPLKNGRHFADDILKCIFLNENVWIPIKISPKFVPKGPINNIPALVQIMAWRRPGDKPLSEPMLVSLPTHIWVARPQWVNVIWTTIMVPHTPI